MIERELSLVHSFELFDFLNWSLLGFALSML